MLLMVILMHCNLLMMIMMMLGRAELAFYFVPSLADDEDDGYSDGDDEVDCSAISLNSVNGFHVCIQIGSQFSM